MKAFEIPSNSKSLENLRLVDRPDPQPGAGQILIGMRAASINARDQSVAAGRYFGGLAHGDIIALSDGAGEVLAAGPGVDRFKRGDRVAGLFAPGWLDGPPLATTAGRAATNDGILAQQVVMDQHDAVLIPADLSFEEAATLPCAAVTAWNALMETPRPVTRGDSVLVLGSGGVSVFALQFARAAGAQVIMTSSSDAKLERGRSLGATHCINYQCTPEWDKEVLRLTAGAGVDCIVEVGGTGTLPLSLNAIAPGGKIALIGVLTRSASSPPLHTLMRKGASIHGIIVGSRAMFERMNQAIAERNIHPVIDKVFAFDKAVEAWRYHLSGAHFGKVVISI